MKIEQSDLLVIGVGNAYRSDDAVGLVVARRISELGLNGLTVKETSGEAACLIEAWLGAGTVILIDAVSSDAEPGAIFRFDAQAQKLPTRLFNGSTHGFGVAEAIELARQLNRLPSRLIVYGIAGGDFTTGTTLSAEVEQAATRTVETIVQEFRAFEPLG